MAQKSKEIAKLQLEMEQVSRTTSLLNQNQVQKLFNSTPDKWTYDRPAKGGGTWRYVKTSYVRKVLDSVFGFAWSFDIETSLQEAFEVAKLTGSIVVKGTLTGKIYKDKEWVELKKTQFGRADVKWRKGLTPDDTDKPKPLDLGNDFKAATSDCLKKCASLFGVAADIYEAGEFQEIEIIGSQENKNKVTKKKVKQLAKELKVEEVND